MHIRTAQGWRLIGGPMEPTPPLPTAWYISALSNLRRTPQLEDQQQAELYDNWERGQFGKYAEDHGRD